MLQPRMSEARFERMIAEGKGHLSVPVQVRLQPPQVLSLIKLARRQGTSVSGLLRGLAQDEIDQSLAWYKT